MTSVASINENNSHFAAQDKSLKVQEKPFHIERGIRWIIFIVFFILNTILNIDHGTVPAANKEIKESLEIPEEDNTEMGFFNSLVFLGLTIGSLISAYLINRFNRKYTLIISLFLCGICLFFFGFCNKIVLYFNRVVIGIFHAFISIYPPVWCNQFGIKDKRTIMIALLQIAPPLGVVLGYGLTILCGKIFNTHKSEINNAWQYAFMIQAFLIWGVMGIFICFRNKFFAQKYHRVPDEQLTPQFAPNTIVSLMKKYPRARSFFYAYEHHDDNDENSKKKEEKKEIKEEDEHSYNNVIVEESENYQSSEDNKNIPNDEENATSSPEHKDNIKQEIVNTSSKSKKKINKKVNITCLVLKQPVFLLCVYALSTMFFILTAIQYECRSYLETALDVKDENKRFIAFSIVCLTSPTSGVLIGSIFINYKGGYETKHSILYCLLFGIISILCTIPVPLVDSLLEFTLWLWLAFFFGGALVTPLNGIIMTSLSKELSSTANSINVMICNLIGYLPAPFIYGWVQNKTQFLNIKYNDRIPMMASLWYAAFGIIALGIAAVIRYRNYDKMYKIDIGMFNNNGDKGEANDDGKENKEEKKEDDIQHENTNEQVKSYSSDKEHPLIPNDY